MADPNHNRKMNDFQRRYNELPALLPEPMSNVDLIISRVREVLNLTATVEEDQYTSLALCAIDSVYSIGARYESTERTVSNFCKWRNWDEKQLLTKREYAIVDFLQDLQPYENQWDRLAEEVFQNRQRTSPRSGILKAEAVYRFATALAKSEIDIIADAMDVKRMCHLENAIKTIPGQRSGISYKYFCMLAGNDNFVKPDRMVMRFVAEALGVPLDSVKSELAETLIIEAAQALKLTARRLDYEIWQYQRLL